MRGLFQGHCQASQRRGQLPEAHQGGGVNLGEDSIQGGGKQVKGEQVPFLNTWFSQTLCGLSVSERGDWGEPGAKETSWSCYCGHVESGREWPIAVAKILRWESFPATD